MILINSDEQLRRAIPNVLANVEGEPSLFEKLYPFLSMAEDWTKDNLMSEAGFDEIVNNSSAANDLVRATLERIVAAHAYMAAIPSLDLVLTPNGFGIVSNQNIAPASRERVDALITSIETQRDMAIDLLLRRISTRKVWQDSTQGRYFMATMFPYLNICQKMGIREHAWEAYQQLHERLIKIEMVLADTYFSHEQMQVFRKHVITQWRSATPLEEQVIRSLQSYELQLLTDIQVHPQCYFDLVNIIREHEEVFPAWHASDVAPLYTPKVFENKKKSSAYWF